GRALVKGRHRATRNRRPWSMRWPSPSSFCPVHNGCEKFIDRFCRFQEMLVYQVALEGLEHLAIGFKSVWPGVGPHEFVQLGNLVEQPRKHGALCARETHLPQGPGLRFLARLIKALGDPGMLLIKALADHQRMHDRVEACAGIEIFLPGTVIWKETRDVAAVV